MLLISNIIAFLSNLLKEILCIIQNRNQLNDNKCHDWLKSECRPHAIFQAAIHFIL